MNVLSHPMILVRQQLPSSPLISAVTPAQRSEAETQRVQSYEGVSLHDLDSQSVSVT